MSSKRWLVDDSAYGSREIVLETMDGLDQRDDIDPKRPQAGEVVDHYHKVLHAEFFYQYDDGKYVKVRIGRSEIDKIVRRIAEIEKPFKAPYEEEF